MRRLALFVLVAVLALAGCAKKEDPTTLTLTASGGVLTQGWDYAGATVVPGAATLSGSLDATANKGNVTVGFDLHGAKWRVLFDEFDGSKPFMDGGVRFGFDEHGDSGNGDASLPKLHAKAAAWGTASVKKDDQPLVGKTGTRWTAHLMVSDDTVRTTEGKILNSAGTASYDPGKPTDAKVQTGKPQGLFFIKSPDGETASRGPLNGTKTLAFQGPEDTQKVDIPAEAGAERLLVNATVQGAQGTPLGAGQLTLTLRDAQGNATKTVQITVAPNNPSTANFEVPGKDIHGAYSLEAKGTGAFSVKVDFLATFDDQPFLVVTWNDITTS